MWAPGRMEISNFQVINMSVKVMLMKKTLCMMLLCLSAPFIAMKGSISDQLLFKAHLKWLQDLCRSLGLWLCTNYPLTKDSEWERDRVCVCGSYVQRWWWLHLLYICRLLFRSSKNKSLSLEGEDRVKLNQTNLSSGNYWTYWYSITNLWRPLEHF